MTVIITMSGRSSRFKDVGIMKPKYMIMTHGLSVFEWSMRSLRHFFEQDFIFAVLNTCDIEWVSQKAHKLGIRNYSFYLRDNYSKGQAETAFDAVVNLAPDCPIWIYDIDTYVSNSPMHPNDIAGNDACVHICKATCPNMSYVKHDMRGKVIQIVEKTVISEWGTIGLFGFKTCKEFIDTYSAAYLEQLIPLTNNEQYLAPIIQVMIDRNKAIISPIINHGLLYSLGTPRELQDFEYNFNEAQHK